MEEISLEFRDFGKLGKISALSLGGGGLGQLWGQTSRAECVATVLMAIEHGINFLDMAPSYGDGEAETVIGEALQGKIPKGIHISTKWWPEMPFPATDQIPMLIEQSLAASLKRMKLDFCDFFFLHGLIIPDHREGQYHGTTLKIFKEVVGPTLDSLVDQGRIGAWGISGMGVAESVIAAIEDSPAPAAVQCIANMLDSFGGMYELEEEARPREIIRAANQQGVNVMGVRAVQAGALTDTFDREVAKESGNWADFQRAEPFRALAKELGESAASLAHRYTLSMDGIATVVLGVKNREELRECLDAESIGALEPELITKIDSFFN
jgi:aryl-alcohol dehydrogenase-like predicted oxidoreductase